MAISTFWTVHDYNFEFKKNFHPIVCAVVVKCFFKACMQSEVWMEREKSLSKVKIIPQIYEGPRGRNGKARLACRTCLSDVSHRAVGRSENPGAGGQAVMSWA